MLNDYLKEVEEEYSKQFDEIMGLEIDPKGNKEMFLIRDENDKVLEGIDFSEEKEELKDFLLSKIKSAYEMGAKDKVKEIKEKIVKEINIALKEGKLTSRLTSLYNQI